MLRLRHVLREYFPAALEAFEDLDAADTLELLSKAPDPASAAKLNRSQIRAALKHARRRDSTPRPPASRPCCAAEQLGRDPVITGAYAATTRSIAAVLATLNEQITALEGQVEQHFGRHPDAEIILSQPGMGPLLGARVLGEFGDAPGRYVDAKARKNYAGTSPVTRRSGKRKSVHARFVHNDRLVDALMLQAQSALRASPGARAYYDKQRARGLNHNAALRQLANRLVGIPHGCLKTAIVYDESRAWALPARPRGAQHPDQDQIPTNQVSTVAILLARTTMAISSTTPTTSTGHSTPARTASSSRSDCDTRRSPNLLAATKTPLIVTRQPHRYTMSSILITRFTQQFNKPVCRFAFGLILSDTRNVSHPLPKTRGFSKFFSDEKAVLGDFKIVVTSESSLFKDSFHART